jgi:hypothetical protein
MPDTNAPPRPSTARDVMFFRDPRLWKTWPFLPVIRRRPDGKVECGVLYDCWTVSGRAGFSATVFAANLFLLPRTEEALLALPRETFDTPEEIAAAGWRVD